MPKCNFVIRYNFVSNEIGSVQSKGRARAPNSECYLIVNKESVNEKREYENLEKEHLMMQALEDIDQMPVDELQSCISQEQVVESLLNFIIKFQKISLLIFAVDTLKDLNFLIKTLMMNFFIKHVCHYNQCYSP